METFGKIALSSETGEPYFQRESGGSVTENSQIERGNERHSGEGKAFADVHIALGEKQRHAGQFVVKEFRSEERAYEEIIKALTLKQAGVPVPNTVRHVEKNGNHYVLYTDLTENNKHKVWSVSDPKEELARFELIPSDIEELQKQATNIATAAASAGYILLPDAYFLRKKSTGEVELIIGDLGWGSYPEDNDDNRDKDNPTYAAKFLSNLDNHTATQPQS